MLIPCIVNIFLLKYVLDVLLSCYLFEFQKYAFYHIFFKTKNWFVSSLDANLNFSKTKNRFVSSLMQIWIFSNMKTDLYLLYMQIWIFPNIKTDLYLPYMQIWIFQNQKLICIFLGADLNFFKIKNWFVSS